MKMHVIHEIFTFHNCDKDHFIVPAGWPQYPDFVPLLRSFHGAPMFCPSCRPSCSNSVTALHGPHSSLQKWQTWPCMEPTSAPCTASWQRSLPLLYADNLPARIWRRKERNERRSYWWKWCTCTLKKNRVKRKTGNTFVLITLQKHWWWSWHSYWRTSAWWFQWCPPTELVLFHLSHSKHIGWYLYIDHYTHSKLIKRLKI